VDKTVELSSKNSATMIPVDDALQASGYAVYARKSNELNRDGRVRSG
jgi:hypothetical protein